MFLPEQMRSLFLLNSGEGEQLVDVGCVVIPSGDLQEQMRCFPNYLSQTGYPKNGHFLNRWTESF